MTEHDKFEAWYKTKWPQDTCWKWHDDEQRYTMFSGIQYLWESWQAALASARLSADATTQIGSHNQLKITAESVDWDRAQWAQKVAAIRSGPTADVCDKSEIDHGC